MRPFGVYWHRVKVVTPLTEEEKLAHQGVDWTGHQGFVTHRLSNALWI